MTTKNSSLPRFASPRKRILAALFDYFLLGSLLYFTHLFLNEEKLTLDLVFSTKVLFTFSYFYFFLTIVPHFIFSQSLGQFLFGIKVVSLKYKRLSLLKCIFRDLIFRPFIILMPHTLFSKNSNAIHDRLAQSIVVEA
jgi:uncharacterized RDD family membrane protein YckC